MTEDPTQNELDNLRGKFVDAPTINSNKPKLKKVFDLHHSPWILRSIIIVLSVVTVVEALLFFQLYNKSLQVNISNPPPVISYPTPAISSEIAPKIETGSAEDYLPEPTQIPLPTELEGLDISYNSDE
jgi:hypothetical protein